MKAKGTQQGWFVDFAAAIVAVFCISVHLSSPFLFGVIALLVSPVCRLKTDKIRQRCFQLLSARPAWAFCRHSNNICTRWLYSIYRQLSRIRVFFIILYGDVKMITYEPFYRTIKQKNISTYKLINTFGVSRSLIDRLKHDKPISTRTIDDLCRFLNCRVEDILVYKQGENESDN